MEKLKGTQDDSKEKRRIRPVFTEIELTKERNRGSDCGPLSVEMLFQTDFPDVKKISAEEIEKEMGKEHSAPSLPADICRLLRQHGYEVTYYSGVKWDRIADRKIPPGEWDEKIKALFSKNPGLLERIGEETFRASAKWLTDNGILSGEITLSQVADRLRSGSRILALVRGGRHIVVVTGIDEKNVYFNDPDTEPVAGMMAHEDFEESWGGETIEARYAINGKDVKR